MDIDVASGGSVLNMVEHISEMGLKFPGLHL